MRDFRGGNNATGCVGKRKVSGMVDEEKKAPAGGGEKKAKIIIDEREGSEFGRLLAGHGAEIEWKTLSVGDFVLSERLVAERKTRADFENSIIDGRLFEQAKRLGESYERAVVIVEGEESSGRVKKESLLGAYSSLVADFGLAVFFTRNSEKTCELLFALAKHEQLAKKVQMRVMEKPKCLTVSDYQKAIIECLPGIGPETARKLLAYFGTPQNVLTADEKKLCEVEGVGKKRAKMLRSVLEGVWKEEE